MTPKRPVAVAIALALVATMATSASPVSAATNIQCQGGPSHFSGFEKQSAANIALTAARATLDKQGAPLCLNPGIATTSASSWWIMITQGPASANDFIQYGFWNCQTWCNFGWPGGETGGQQHEYYERNNGNWDGNWRIDLGNPAAGAYTMRMFHQGGASPHWDFTRDGVLKAQHPDTFRDWSLFGAKFAVYSETWDKGDQNGGSAGNTVRMTKTGWGLNHAGINNVGMNACVIAPNNPNGWYQCVRFATNIANDSVRTWTVDR